MESGRLCSRERAPLTASFAFAHHLGIASWPSRPHRFSSQLCKPSRRNLWHSAAAAQLGWFLSVCLQLGYAKNRTLEAVGSIPISSTARSLGFSEVVEGGGGASVGNV
jgi:hypothetical protein